jgi:hypothetical protein
MKPLATAKVTISGDLDQHKLCLFGGRKETTSLHVKLTNLSRYFVVVGETQWKELN